MLGIYSHAPSLISSNIYTSSYVGPDLKYCQTTLTQKRNRSLPDKEEIEENDDQYGCSSFTSNEHENANLFYYRL